MGLYLGVIDDEPVARSLVFYSSGVAGLYLIEVLEPYRRRGIGTAMTAAPILEAQKAGYELAVLMASEMGEYIYSRMGFLKYLQLKYYRMPS